MMRPDGRSDYVNIGEVTDLQISRNLQDQLSRYSCNGGSVWYDEIVECSDTDWLNISQLVPSTGTDWVLNGQPNDRVPITMETVAATIDLFNNLPKISDKPECMPEFHSFWLERYRRGDIHDLRSIRGMSDSDADFIQEMWISARFHDVIFGPHALFFGLNRHLEFLFECIQNVPRLRIGIIPFNKQSGVRIRDRIVESFGPLAINAITWNCIRLGFDTSFFFIYSNQDFRGRALDIVVVEEPRE